MESIIMLKQTLVIGIVGLGMAISTPSMARPHHHGPHYNDYQHIQPVRHCVPGYRVDKRQANQKRRINRGIRKGLIIKWEKRELKQQQRQIRKAERRMRADGCLTRKENHRLLNRLNHVSDRIDQLTHNHLRRGGHHRYNRH